MRADESFQPFSNGFEFEMWTGNNCARGSKGCRSYNPEASTSKDGCPMEVGIALASCTDGQVKAAHGLRAGLLEPGAGGALVMAAGDASTWRCPEYRGYDGPDDRPRRVPPQPPAQLDLLDPRSAPVRDVVASGVRSDTTEGSGS